MLIKFIDLLLTLCRLSLRLVEYLRLADLQIGTLWVEEPTLLHLCMLGLRLENHRGGSLLARLLRSLDRAHQSPSRIVQSAYEFSFPFQPLPLI